MPLKFSKDNPPVFDFVAIKAVKTKTGYLFPEHTPRARDLDEADLRHQALLLF